MSLMVGNSHHHCCRAHSNKGLLACSQVASGGTRNNLDFPLKILSTTDEKLAHAKEPHRRVAYASG